MYDENLVNDSLEACRNINSIKEMTSDKLFADLDLFIKEKSENRAWEKVLDEIADLKSPYTFVNDIKNKEEKQKVNSETEVKASVHLSIINNIITFAICIAVAFCLATFITTYVAHQTTVEGESMEPSLKNNDSIIIQKLSYHWKNPERFDVVVFPVQTDSNGEEDIYYIKRVIGLPGEVVQIIDGEVYINGTKLNGDSYAKEEIADPGVVSEPVKLDDDEYFVLGDNRNMSTDSRYKLVGMVKRDDIVGEAWYCVWPFSHIKKL